MSNVSYKTIEQNVMNMSKTFKGESVDETVVLLSLVKDKKLETQESDVYKASVKQKQYNDNGQLYKS